MGLQLPPHRELTLRKPWAGQLDIQTVSWSGPAVWQSLTMPLCILMLQATARLRSFLKTARSWFPSSPWFLLPGIVPTCPFPYLCSMGFSSLFCLVQVPPFLWARGLPCVPPMSRSSQGVIVYSFSQNASGLPDGRDWSNSYWSPTTWIMTGAQGCAGWLTVWVHCAGNFPVAQSQTLECMRCEGEGFSI